MIHERERCERERGNERMVEIDWPSLAMAQEWLVGFGVYSYVWVVDRAVDGRGFGLDRGSD